MDVEQFLKARRWGNEWLLRRISQPIQKVLISKGIITKDELNAELETRLDIFTENFDKIK